jgi:hypothetical protein
VVCGGFWKCRRTFYNHNEKLDSWKFRNSVTVCIRNVVQREVLKCKAGPKRGRPGQANDLAPLKTDTR